MIRYPLTIVIVLVNSQLLVSIIDHVAHKQPNLLCSSFTGIIEQAAQLTVCESICSFCSRMKRGRLYACARREGYNVLAMGQHLDDLAERCAIKMKMGFFFSELIFRGKQ